MEHENAKAVPVTRFPSSLIIFFIYIIPPLLWAGNYIVGRAIRDDIPPVTLTLTRWAVALLIMLPFAAPYIRRDFKRYMDFPIRLIAVSLSGITAFSLLVYYGLHHTSGTNALLLNSCAPVLIMLFSALFFRAKLSLLQIIGLLVSCSGVITIIFRGDPHEMLNLALSSGDLLLLGAMASFAFYTLWLKKIPSEINRMGLLGMQVIITLIAVFPLWIMEYRAGTAVYWTGNTISAVMFLGCFPSFIAYLLYGRCVETVGAATAGLSIHLIPVFGVVLSVLFLGETIHFYHLVGIAIIFAGVGLASFKSKRI